MFTKAEVNQFKGANSDEKVQSKLMERNAMTEEELESEEADNDYKQFTTDASAPVRYNSVLGVVATGTTTNTVTDKLKDTNASFDSSMVGHIVYNLTDETNVNITAVDSATVLSKDADIMPTAKKYIIKSDVIEIDKVDFDGYSIPRLCYIPEKRDLT